MTKRLFAIFLGLGGTLKSVFAETGNPSPSIQLVNPIGANNFQDLANKIIDGLYALSLPVVSIMILWGGFQMLTAAGNPERLKEGKKTVLYAAIGFAIILMAKGVVLIIRQVLG